MAWKMFLVAYRIAAAGMGFTFIPENVIWLLMQIIIIVHSKSNYVEELKKDYLF